MNIWRSSPNELHQSVRVLLHFVLYSEAGLSLTDHRNTFPLMVERLLMQAIQLPRKMMGGDEVEVCDQVIIERSVSADLHIRYHTFSSKPS